MLLLLLDEAMLLNNSYSYSDEISGDNLQFDIGI
jgi:hypothetical protein